MIHYPFSFLSLMSSVKSHYLILWKGIPQNDQNAISNYDIQRFFLQHKCGSIENPQYSLRK